MRRLHATALRLALALSLTLLAAAVLLAVVASTEGGTRLALKTVGVLSGGAVRVAAARGRLSGPLELQGVRVRGADLDVSISRLRLEWSPEALWQRRLDITKLEAEGVEVSGVPRLDPPPSLPFQVLLREAHLRGVQLGLGERRHLLDRIDFVTREVDGRIVIERLSARSEAFRLDGTGRLASRDSPLQLQAAWSLVRGDSSPLGGHLTVGGTLQQLRLLHQLTAPALACLEIELTGPPRDAAFEAELALPGLRPSDLNPEWPAALVSGHLRASGTLHRFMTGGTLLARMPEGEVETARATLAVERHGETWVVERLDIRTVRNPALVTLTGSVRMDEGTPRFDLSGTWRQGARAPGTTRRHGTIRASGTPSAHALEVVQAEAPHPTRRGRGTRVAARPSARG